jgi:hypothetical protein
MDAEIFGKEEMYQLTWESGKVGGNVAIRAMVM